MRFDLHVHSSYSDGSMNLTELGARAKEKGLGGFALTDHDTIAGWREIAKVEEIFGLRMIPGVELSTEQENSSVHILGYCIKETDCFNAKLKRLAEARVHRAEKIIEKLNGLDMNITLAEVLAAAGEGTVGRPHIAAVLTEKGYVKNKQDAFKRFLNRGKPCYVPRKKFSPEEAVELIKKCGGYAVLAHPGLDGAKAFIDALTAVGLDGIEAYHSSHTVSASRKFVAIAQSKGLAVTAGSDFHGGGGGTHGDIGSVTLEAEYLPDFIHRYWEEQESCGRNLE